MAHDWLDVNPLPGCPQRPETLSTPTGIFGCHNSSPELIAAAYSALVRFLSSLMPPGDKTKQGENASHPETAAGIEIPAPPSTLAEFPAWIQSARELLRDQEDQPIEENATARLVRKHFLDHLERLCPEWAHWQDEFQRQKLPTVRDLVAKMELVRQHLTAEAPPPRVVRGFAAGSDKPPADKTARGEATIAGQPDQKIEIVADTAAGEDEPPMPRPDAKGNYPAVEAARVLLARKLIRRRRVLGLTQAELAKLARVRVETISRLENGRHSPNVATVDKIVRALDRAEKGKRK